MLGEKAEVRAQAMRCKDMCNACLRSPLSLSLYLFYKCSMLCVLSLLVSSSLSLSPNISLPHQIRNRRGGGGGSGGVCDLLVSGYLRGIALDADQMVYLTGAGAFHLRSGELSWRRNGRTNGRMDERMTSWL